MPISLAHRRQLRQCREDQDRLWDALGCDLDFDHQDKDVYTLAIEAIEERALFKASLSNLGFNLDMARTRLNESERQIATLESRLEQEKNLNRELCAIDNIGTLVHDLEVAKRSLEFYRAGHTHDMLRKGDAYRDALKMIRRLVRVCVAPLFPSKTIDKLATHVLEGLDND